LAVRRLRDVLGEEELRVTSVGFLHAARGPAAPYEAFFRAPVEFDCGSESVVYPRSLLQLPLITASRSLSKLLAAHPAPTPVRARAFPNEDAFVRRVRDAIGSCLAEGDARSGVEEVSGALGTSARSLQRRLSERGTSYSTLLDEVRREQAETLLSREGVLLAEVAYRLGFVDLSAFFRAFRQWTGMTPRQFQRTRLEKPPRSRHSRH
jgi:AraC-like DNA-binding protein